MSLASQRPHRTQSHPQAAAQSLAEAVYAAWTDPEKIVKWFGPDSGPVEHAELDVRVGGRYSIAFRTENGEQHHVSGVYREVVPNEKLSFTWAWRSRRRARSRSSPC